jgi:DNA-binding MarR family transcriptional regulator
VRPESDLDPTLDFMRLLWSIEHGLQRASKRMEAALGVTGPQRLVLRVLDQSPEMTAQGLAQLLHLHPSTVTGILQRLEKKGMLSRVRDVSDHRRVRLHVKPRGQRLNEPSSRTIEAVVSSALGRLPASRVKHARVVLAAVADALGESIE